MSELTEFFDKIKNIKMEDIIEIDKPMPVIDILNAIVKSVNYTLVYENKVFDNGNYGENAPFQVRKVGKNSDDRKVLKNILFILCTKMTIKGNEVFLSEENWKLKRENKNE